MPKMQTPLAFLAEIKTFLTSRVEADFLPDVRIHGGGLELSRSVLLPERSEEKEGIKRLQ